MTLEQLKATYPGREVEYYRVTIGRTEAGTIAGEWSAIIRARGQRDVIEGPFALAEAVNDPEFAQLTGELNAAAAVTIAELRKIVAGEESRTQLAVFEATEPLKSDIASSEIMLDVLRADVASAQQAVTSSNDKITGDTVLIATLREKIAGLEAELEALKAKT